MAYNGQCACGAVTLAIEAEPVAVRQCWCRMCQRMSSGSASTNALFPEAAIAITGELGWFTYQADSGNMLRRGFCPECGTQIIAASSGNPQFRGIRLGVIDPPHALAPQVVIWTDEAPAWAAIPDHLPRFGGQPPAPQATRQD